MIRHEESASVDTLLTRDSANVPIVDEEEIVAGAFPFVPPKVGIYFLIRENAVVYVGQSANIEGRIPQHAAFKTFDKWAWLECEPHEMNVLERQYIDAMLPEYNLDPRTRRLRGDWSRRTPPAEADGAAGLLKQSHAGLR